MTPSPVEGGPADGTAAPLAPRASPCSGTVHGSPDGGQRAGSGRLHVALVDGESAALSCVSVAPLRLLVPRARGPAVWAVAASYGGGLVGGDEVALALDVDEGASALLSTQAETKAYRSIAAPCRQELRARIAPGGTLVLLPDPVSCFAGARYRQLQRFQLAPGGSLLFLDALVSGRSARGERWAFEEYASRNEVVAGGRLLLSDALRMAAGEGPPVAARLDEMELVATLVLLGPRFAAPARALRETIDALPAREGAEPLVCASPLADGLHLRLASRSVEAGLAYLRRHLGFLPALLGEDPFSRRT